MLEEVSRPTGGAAGGGAEAGADASVDGGRGPGDELVHGGRLSDLPKCRRQERLQELSALEERRSLIEAGSDCDSDELDVLQLCIASLQEEEELLLNKRIC